METSDPEDMPIGDVWGGNAFDTAHVFCPKGHPVSVWVERWVESKPFAKIIRSIADLTAGDFLFLISCGEIIGPEIRGRYRHTLVIHASDLPKDRGWSPVNWLVSEGANELTVSLIDCADPVDSGAIWNQERITLDGTELFDEIMGKLFDAELRLMDWAMRYCDSSKPREQQGEPSYRRKRTPDDSRIDPEKSIAEQFDLIRACDPERYPAFFDYRGAKYAISIRKAG